MLTKNVEVKVAAFGPYNAGDIVPEAVAVAGGHDVDALVGAGILARTYKPGNCDVVPAKSFAAEDAGPLPVAAADGDRAAAPTGPGFRVATAPRTGGTEVTLVLAAPADPGRPGRAKAVGIEATVTFVGGDARKLAEVERYKSVRRQADEAERAAKRERAAAAKLRAEKLALEADPVDGLMDRLRELDRAALGHDEAADRHNVDAGNLRAMARTHHAAATAAIVSMVEHEAGRRALAARDRLGAAGRALREAVPPALLAAVADADAEVASATAGLGGVGKYHAGMLASDILGTAPAAG